MTTLTEEKVIAKPEGQRQRRRGENVYRQAAAATAIIMVADGNNPSQQTLANWTTNVTLLLLLLTCELWWESPMQYRVEHPSSERNTNQIVPKRPQEIEFNTAEHPMCQIQGRHDIIQIIPDNHHLCCLTCHLCSCSDRHTYIGLITVTNTTKQKPW